MGPEKLVRTQQKIAVAVLALAALAAALSGPARGDDDGGGIELRRPAPARSAAPAPGADLGDVIPAYDIAPPAEPLTWDTIHETLDPVGAWLDVPGLGRAWIPDERVVGKRFVPYRAGRWIYTERGWSWSSSYTWGWIPSHYGRWREVPGTGWVWLPGLVWAPAYVRWRMLEDGIGWIPGDAGAAESDRPPTVVVRRADFLARNLECAASAAATAAFAREPVELARPGGDADGPSAAAIEAATGEDVRIVSVQLPSRGDARGEDVTIVSSRVRSASGAGTVTPADAVASGAILVAPQAPMIFIGGDPLGSPTSAARRPLIIAPHHTITPMQPIGPPGRPLTPQAPVAPQAPIGAH
jgi:hypothetical protein